jgi:hypothetical protein
VAPVLRCKIRFINFGSPSQPWHSFCVAQVLVAQTFLCRFGKEAEKQAVEHGATGLALLAVYRDAAVAAGRKAHRSDCATRADFSLSELMV